MCAVIYEDTAAYLHEGRHEGRINVYEHLRGFYQPVHIVSGNNELGSSIIPIITTGDVDLVRLVAVVCATSEPKIDS